MNEAPFGGERRTDLVEADNLVKNVPGIEGVADHGGKEGQGEADGGGENLLLTEHRHRVVNQKGKSI